MVRVGLGQMTNPTLKDLNFVASEKVIHLPRELAQEVVRQVQADTSFLQSNSIMDYSLIISIAKTFQCDATVLAKICSNTRSGKLYGTTFQQRNGYATGLVEQTATIYVYSFGIIDTLQPYDIYKKVANPYKAVRCGSKEERDTVDYKQYASRFINFIRSRISTDAREITPQDCAVAGEGRRLVQDDPFDDYNQARQQRNGPYRQDPGGTGGISQPPQGSPGGDYRSQPRDGAGGGYRRGNDGLGTGRGGGARYPGGGTVQEPQGPCFGASKQLAQTKYETEFGPNAPGLPPKLQQQQKDWRGGGGFPFGVLLVLLAVIALAGAGAYYMVNKPKTALPSGNIEMPQPQAAQWAGQQPVPFQPQPPVQQYQGQWPAYRQHGVDFGLETPGQAPTQIITAAPPVGIPGSTGAPGAPPAAGFAQPSAAASLGFSQPPAAAAPGLSRPPLGFS